MKALDASQEDVQNGESNCRLAKSEWLAAKRREWEQAHQRRKSMTNQLEGFAAAEPTDATRKREWLNSQREKHNRAMASRKKMGIDEKHLIVDASLLSTPTDRELFLRALHTQREASRRERRRLAAEAELRPVVRQASKECKPETSQQEDTHSPDCWQDLSQDSMSNTATETDGISTTSPAEVRATAFVACVAMQNSLGQHSHTTSILVSQLGVLDDLEAIEQMQLQEQHHQYHHRRRQQQLSIEQQQSETGSTFATCVSPRGLSRPSSAPHYRLIASPGSVLPSSWRSGVSEDSHPHAMPARCPGDSDDVEDTDHGVYANARRCFDAGWPADMDPCSSHYRGCSPMSDALSWEARDGSLLSADSLRRDHLHSPERIRSGSSSPMPRHCSEVIRLEDITFLKCR